jgi:hypothetical protein
VGMGKISRIDRTIGLLLLALLLGLLALALVHRSNPAHSASPVATTPSSTSPSSTSSSGPTTTGSASTGSTPSGSPSSGSPSSGPTRTTSSAAASPTTAPASVPVAGPVSAVGDSIMLDIQPYLQADVPGAHIDGTVSRQFETGIGVVQAERASGTLGTVLVVELGTNGSVTPSDFDAMMQAASGVKRVVFVNINVPRSWAAPDNAVLAAGVARYRGVAVLADWNSLSGAHPEWFTPDQVHLQPVGAQALAALVAQYA